LQAARKEGKRAYPRRRLSEEEAQAATRAAGISGLR
jgi:hypothetical protein